MKRTPTDKIRKGDLTPKSVIMELILSGVDGEYYNSRYRQIHYAFGEPWDKTSDACISIPSGDLPDFPEIQMGQKEIGRSCRISNAEFWALQGVMQRAPTLRSPQVDKLTNEVRAQFFQNRYRGTGYRDGEWGQELENAFIDGHGLGSGWLEVGVIDDPVSGRQKVHLRHSPLLRTFWDRTERNPGRAAWWCSTIWMDKYDAIAEYGEAAVRKAGTRMARANVGQNGIEQVRVTRYFDIGIGNSAPTMAIILGSISGGEYVTIEANPFGCIPAAYYTHVLLPGMDRPLGQIAMQMATQEMINIIERQMRESLKIRPFRIIDVGMFDENDLLGVMEGKQSSVRMKRALNDTRPPAFEVPGIELPSTTLQYLQLLERQYNSDSGQNDIDRGNLSDERRTLGEVELMDARSSTQTGWAMYQATRMIERVGEKVFKIAAKYDRAPAMLDVFGSNIQVNDPINPVTWMDQWLDEPSSIIVDAQSLRQPDTMREKAMRLQELERLAAFGVNPVWLQREALKALGETDLADAMGQPSQTAGMPMGGGMPMDDPMQDPAMQDPAAMMGA